MGSIRPPGTDVVAFPHGPSLAVLADANTPWPTESSKAAGMKFGGLQLDTHKRPTLLYSFRDAGVEDFLAPPEGAGKAGLRRTVKFTDPPPDGLHLRLVVDKLVRGHLHELHLPGVRDRSGERLMHDVAYYTLNEIPKPQSLQ